MNASQISVRYAKALFQSARDKDVLDEVRNNMETVDKVCDIPEVKHMLVNPVMKESKKSEVLEKLFKKELHPLSMSLLNLVVQNGRDQYISSIARNFIDLYKHHKGITTAEITSTIALPEEIQSKVKIIIEQTLKMPVELTTKMDKDLIGGFVITIDQLQYDASVSSSLKKVKKQLLN